MKLFSIEFRTESMDFCALTPFIAVEYNGFAIAWLKWAIRLRITIK